MKCRFKSNVFFALILSAGLILPEVTGQSGTIQTGEYTLRLNALGRSARLGGLYDAYTETFTGLSLLNRDLPESLISKTDTPSTNTKLGVTKSSSDKRELFGVSAELSLSVMAGKVEVSGSGKYLQDTQNQANSVQGAVVYETLTCEEVIEIFYDDIREYINMEVLEAATETHVVIGMGWGANVIVQMEDSNHDNKDVTEIEGAMKITLPISIFGVSVAAEVVIGDRDLSGFSRYSMQLFGDLTFGTFDYPTNIVQVISLIAEIPALVRQSEGGKGRPLYFYLLPLEKLWEFMKRGQVNLNSRPSFAEPPQTLEADVVESQLQLLEEINIVTLKLNDLTDQMMSHRPIFSNEDIRRLKDLRRDFLEATEDYKRRLRSKLGQRVKKSSDFHDLEMTFRHGRLYESASLRADEDSSLDKIEKVMDNSFREVRLKIELMDYLESVGAIWVGRESTVDLHIIKTLHEVGTNVTLCGIHFYPDYLTNGTVDFIKPVLSAAALNETALITDCNFPIHSTCAAPVSRIKTCTRLYTPPPPPPPPPPTAEPTLPTLPTGITMPTASTLPPSNML